MALSLTMLSVDGSSSDKEAAGVRPGFRRAWIDEAVRPLESLVPRGAAAAAEAGARRDPRSGGLVRSQGCDGNGP